MFRVITLNVQGLRDLVHRQTLVAWLNCFQPDIICIQETHSTSEKEFSDWFSPNNRNIDNKLKYKCILSPGSTRSSGVGILFKPCFQVVQKWRDEAGRLVVAEFNRDDLNFQVVCLYGPNKKDEGAAFFESFYQVIDPDLPVFLCGDFNTVVDPRLDRFGCNPESPWAYNWSSTLSDLTAAFELCDAWRAKHPGDAEFTWRRPNGAQGSRIDMIWLPERYLGSVSSVGIFPFFRSDHSYVYLEINLPSMVERGKGRWKFNTSHLSDETCHEIERFWVDWRSETGRFHSLSSWWDAGKVRLKGLIRRLSRASSRDKKRKIQALNTAVADIQKRLDNGEQLPGLLEERKAELASELLSEAKGAQLRANIRWAEEGESSTAYFLRQEQVRGQRRLIRAVRRKDGTVAKSPSDILGVWRDYYFALFSSQDLEDDEQQLFLDSLERTLSPAETELCEGDLTEEECLRALKHMATSKSPGVDGLPAEFYVRFWRLLGPDLVNVLNSCYRCGCLSLTQRTGAITLLYKKGDLLDTANWRPITLLCVDYKIAAKALSNRLLNVIGSVVSPDQSCGVPGRFIGENVRLLQDIVDYANTEAVPAAILSLDQEKAFDRVEWTYMEKVLVKMGFGTSFRGWARLLYTNVYSRVIVNGFATEPFPVSRGVRQGCPLSPLLYVLVAESLACAIRADNNIVGFPLPGGREHAKIVQYADDTSILVTTDSSVLSMVELFGRYEKALGAKLNPAKCQGLPLGPWRNRSSFPVDFRWSSAHITALGSRLSNEGGEDWGPRVSKLEATLNSWRARTLTFRGRSLIVNVLGLSLFWYLASVTYIPNTVIKKINSLIFPFVWGKKREWLSRDTASQPLDRGGLGVVDITKKVSAFRVLWVKRFLLGEKRGWHSFFRHYLRRAFLAEPVSRVFNLRQIGTSTQRKLPPFYREVISAWLQVGGHHAPGGWVVPCTGADPLALSNITSRDVYTILVRDSGYEHRCVEKYSALGVEWRTVWKNLDLMRHDRVALDTSWLVAHGVLPTADRLLWFGMTVSPWCHCGRRESIEHLFVECSFISPLIDWFHALLSNFRPSLPRPTSREIRFSYKKADNIPAGFSVLMALVRHQVWVARNFFRFENLQPEPRYSLERVKTSFRFLARLQQRLSLRSHFEAQWLAGGVLGTVCGDGTLAFPDELHSRLRGVHLPRCAQRRLTPGTTRHLRASADLLRGWPAGQMQRPAI